MLTTLAGLLDQAPRFAGEFETHLTVAPLAGEELARFERTCQDLGVKCIRIELARGQTRSQPMTGSRHAGTAQQTLALALRLAEQVEQHGFAVTRVKIEAAPTNVDVPETDEQATLLPPGNYHEHHIKLLLPVDQDLLALTHLAEQHRAHLSHNALKQRADGLSERFLTVRHYGVGRGTAANQVQALLADLERAGFTILKTEGEYCFFDSNEQVDAGWLKAEASG